MKRMFKTLTSLLLTVALLLTPCFSTATTAVEEGVISEETGGNLELMATSTSTLTFKGAYFLKNPRTGRYIDLASGATAPYDGDKLEQWDYDGSAAQKWVFTQVNAGTAPYYHTIKNLETGLYMTVKNNSTGNDVDIVLAPLSGTGSDGQLWVVEATSNGRYKIIPKCGEGNNRVLCVNDSLFGTTGNGLNIKSRTYTNDTNYKDEWQLEFCSVYVQLSYDQGYVSIHRQTGESDATVKQRIVTMLRDTCFPIAANAFAEKCKVVLLNNQATLINYTSCADTCTTPSTHRDCSCIANEDCILLHDDEPSDNNDTAGFAFDAHCKSIIRLRNNLIVNLPNDTIRVTYTGHPVCYLNGSGTHGYSTKGLSDYYNPIVAMRVTLVETVPNYLLYSFVHELSHTYGATHHYGTGDSQCVMYSTSTENFNPDDTSTYWCDSCIATIKSNANKY